MSVSVLAMNYDNAQDVSNYSNSKDSLSSSSNITYALDNPTSTASDPEPDLVIIDIWRGGGTIYYKIKNQGTANAGDSYSSLTVEGVFKASDYVAPLEPGAERTGSFTYNWTYTPPVDNITICANYQHTVTELDEKNNCKSKTLVSPPPLPPTPPPSEVPPRPRTGVYPAPYPAPGFCYGGGGSGGGKSASSNIGFSTGGAKDINNFRENIKNDYLPLPTDITYEGLFYDYYFDTGEKEECLKLFCPSYSYAISNDPFSEEKEYYLSVGLNSGIKESDFQRKKLNLIIVLDISGSMSSSFNRYYYDRFGNRVEVNETEDSEKAKIEVATEAVVALLDHLEDDDRFGMVLFNTSAEVAEPVSLVGDKNMQKLKDDILEISATGGTRLSAGMRLATELFDEFSDVNQSEYENRIIFLTDAMPNLGDTSEEGLLGMTENNANNKVYTTFIGIGVDFNTELVEYITKIRGANYYSVHSAKQFKERMDDEFEYMVTPLVFDLQLNLNATGYEIEKVYGSPEADEATGEIMKVKTLFPSKKEDGETRGGLVLLKLRKLSTENSLKLKLNVSYEDRNGVIGSDEATVELEEKEPDFFENTGIRKGILLSRYANLIKNWIIDERESIEKNEMVTPSVNSEEGIVVPIELGRWERQSIPLRVSEPYKELFKEFSIYFEKEMNAIGDDTLGQELDILDILKASLDYKGMSYSSWTRGEYPFTVNWKPQTYWDSQAITEVNITPNKPYSGQGSLEADVNLIGQDPNKSSGETFVDLRYHPPLSDPPCCVITPVDFKGVMIKARVWCPEGIQGYSHAPNGLQLFVKDQAWKSFYGSWHNIKGNKWNEITVTPDTVAPSGGWMDHEFDPTKIVMIGVKIGANENWYGNFSGKIWIDDVTWSKDECTFQYTFENIENSLDTLRKTNTNYVSLIVTWYMDNKNSSIICPDPIRSHTDPEIEKTISEIHNRGMGVLLKPHVDVKDEDTWRGAIDPADKDAWFNSYRYFITHYATIARNNNVELFCVGTELESLSGEAFRSQWNTTIDDIRSVYKGPLTYAANWDGYKNVSFWDKIDILGIDAYFPLSDAPYPSLDELMKGWVNYSGKYGNHNWVEEIESWQSNINKPVIFTEIGYRNIDYAAQEPWNSSRIEPSNCTLQALCYEAAIDTFKNKPWFKGMFWWNWLTVSDAGGCCNTEFTPQNKPAEDVITEKYSKFEWVGGGEVGAY